MIRKVPEKYQKILEEIKNNTYISRLELATKLNQSPVTIQSRLRKLIKEGLLRRVGPDKGGHWEVADINKRSDGDNNMRNDE